MGDIYIKVRRDRDFYIHWDKSSDQPIRWGSAYYLGLDGDRKSRADEYGSSLHSPYLDFDSTDGLIMRDMGTKRLTYWIKRSDLEAFFDLVDSLSEDDKISHEEIQYALDRFAESV